MTQPLPLLAVDSTPVANPTLALPMDYNVTADFLDGALARGWGARVAIRPVSAEGTAGETWTYARLAEYANRTGNALARLGVELEQRVAVLLYDSPQFAASFFGAMKLGAVPIPTNTALRPQDYVYMLNDSRSRVLIVEADLWPQIAAQRSQLRFLRHVLVVEHDKKSTLHGDAAKNVESFAKLVDKASPKVAAAPTIRDDSAFWAYSSGSTGFPKGCVHLQHDMRCCAELYAKPILQLTPDDICFSSAKLYFTYGLGNALYFPLAAGASAIHFPGRPTAESAFTIISQQRPTVFFGAPTLYAAMLALPDAEKRYDISSLRLCVSAGESLPAEIYNRWRERYGIDILDGIGSTEILHIFISNVPGQVVPGSSGRLVPGYEAAILDEQGQAVPQGEIGNLLVSGDSICSQYWNKHERTKATIVGRWIQTGDKYSQDEAGNYWYAGRSDDMLKVSGQWVSPVEVEATLIAHPAVLAAAVIGREDRDGLTKPMAFIVLKDGNAPSEALADELKQYVKTTLLPHKYPRWVEFVKELPMTATGKIQRYRLREQVRERDEATAGAQSS
jgi:benzoate-CoA ligase